MVITPATSVDYASPEYAIQVEGQLRALQDSHRLAIHQWETFQRYALPDELLTQLDRKPEHIPDDIKDHKPNATFSMSLLPSTRSGLSIEPYNVELFLAPDPGYLFNLSQENPHPPKVMMASQDNIYSTDDVYNKVTRFKPYNKEEAPLLTEFYRRYMTYEQLKHAIASDPTVSEEQLDRLGKTYEGNHLAKHMFMSDDATVATHNEILVSAARSHIAAISLPDYNIDPSEPNANIWGIANGESIQASPPERRAFLQLIGTLSGLEHLTKGLDLPVVFYHVNGPEQNKVTFVGQGKEMLTAKALEALHTLQEHHTFDKFQGYDPHFKHLEKRILEMLHVNLRHTNPEIQVTKTHPRAQIDERNLDGSGVRKETNETIKPTSASRY